MRYSPRRRASVELPGYQIYSHQSAAGMPCRAIPNAGEAELAASYRTCVRILLPSLRSAVLAME
ncbi:hypothetical protein [Cupriavidus sp. TMH.W2]|uniref:hypothetical protein n=1 Tax=Cupriavidus sp. TMH.W2 TaxID=3434465 RepID=UPI003D784A92